MTGGLIVGLANLVAALVIIALAIPLIRRKVPMNNLYGVRMGKSLESVENWYTVNEFGGRRMAAGGGLLFVIALVILVFHHRIGDLIAVLLSLLPVAAVLIPFWQTYRFARRLP